MDGGMLSVGIDIGTYTTQVVFSRLKVKNTAAPYTIPHIVIAEKEIVHRGQVHLTPLHSRALIDGEAIRRIVEGEYAAAGVGKQMVETGAVIITGESACKENAREVLEKLADFAGDFVVSSAGPDMEGVIAGKGSGACRFSEEESTDVVNLDIGGGTTNLAFFSCGEDAGTACYDVGGRLVRLDGEMRVTYLSPAAAAAAEDALVSLRVGVRTDERALRRLAQRMARLLEEALGLAERSALLRRLLTKGSSAYSPAKRPRAVCFSGGVSEYVYRTEENAFLHGDIGVLLGRAIRESGILGAFELVRPEETIQATVVGAGSYTTELSGSTVDFSPALLPMKNVPVLKLTPAEEDTLWQGSGDTAAARIKWFLAQQGAERLALALTGRPSPRYDEVRSLAAGLANAFDRALARGAPAVVVLEHDMAKALGQALRRSFASGRACLCIDSVRMHRGDFIDLGQPVAENAAIPVVIKTLIFG